MCLLKRLRQRVGKNRTAKPKRVKVILNNPKRIETKAMRDRRNKVNEALSREQERE